MSDFDLEASRRLPLADAALRLLDYATQDDFLLSVFERHRGRSYAGAISFPLLVHLMSDALLGHRGSAHQTFRQAQEAGQLNASVQAMYGKLGRVPISLSEALFAAAAARLAEVGVPAGDPPPVSLASFRNMALDGKKLKYVVKRIKQLRGLKGNVFGGKLLVAQDIASGQAVVVEATADGEAGDNPLVCGAVAQARALGDARPRLWIADRAFCDFKTLNLLSQGGDHFVVRFHSRCSFHIDPDHPSRTGIDEQGRPFREEWGWLGKPNNPQRVRVRQITVKRPKAGPLVLVTSLLDADSCPAIDLLVVYRRRWGIETMFQRVVQTFDLRNLIGGTPEATVFQAVFCLLLYNTTLIVRDYVAAGAKRSSETVSLHLLFDEMVRDLTAWMHVIGPEATADVLAAELLSGPTAFRKYLHRILGTLWTERWAKAKTTKRPPKKPPRAYLRGGHSSVYKILRGEHEEIPIKPHKQPPAT